MGGRAVLVHRTLPAAGIARLVSCCVHMHPDARQYVVQAIGKGLNARQLVVQACSACLYAPRVGLV